MSQKTPSVSELIRAASGPCIVIREGDIDALREKRKNVQWAASAFSRLKGSAETWMKKQIRIPDRGGQWPHWYACEVDGVPLKMQSPTVHRCPRCDRVYSGEPWDSVPLTEIHEELANAVLSLGVYHALTGSVRAAEKAAEILLGYAEMYPRYPVRDHGQHPNTAWAAKVSWGTLGESIWLQPLCGGYDLIRHANVFTPAEHQYIREQLLRPAAKLILKNNLGIHNIQCWHNAAIASVGLLLKDRDLVSFAVEGEVGIQSQIARGILPDGFWFEGSWGYHFYGMRPLLTLAETLRNCGMDLYDDHFKGIFEAPLLAVRPDGGMPAFHDSAGPELSQTHALYEIGFSRYGDPRFATPLIPSKRKHLNALLYGSAELPDPVSVENTSTHLSRSGFVYLRQGPANNPTYLALDYGPHGGGHGHPDKLSFILFARGQVQAPDPDASVYGVPHYTGWYKQTVSHNTLTVDQRSQKSTRGTLNVLVNGPDFDLVSATSEEAYPDVKLSRTLLFKEDLVLLIDRVTSGRSHTLDWVYHNRGDMRTAFSRKPMKVPPGETHGYDWIQDPRLGTPEGNWKVDWRSGEVGVRLTMLASNKVPTEVITGLGLDNSDPGTDGTLTPLVIARRRNRRTTYRAALQVYGKRAVNQEISRAEVDPPGRARGMTLIRKNTTITLISSLSPGPVTWKHITYEGQAIYAEQANRAPERIVLAEGTCLHWKDTTWQLDPVGSVMFNDHPDSPRITNLGSEAVAVRVNGHAYPLAPSETVQVEMARPPQAK